MVVFRRGARYDYSAAADGEAYAPLRPGDDELSWGKVAAFLVAVPFLAIRWVVTHWPVTVPVFTATGVWTVLGSWGVVVAGAGLVVGGVGWRVAHRASFTGVVVVPFRRWQRRLTYRRVWTATMHNAGLTRGFGPERVAPRIIRMRLRGPVDRLLVQLLVGQSVDELRAVVPALIDTFDALRVTITPDTSSTSTSLGTGSGGVSLRRAGRVWVHLVGVDHLESTVAPIPPAEPATITDDGPVVDLERLTVGLREDGAPWTVSLAGGSHLLIGGATGSGKSSVLWSIIHALGPGIRDGSVQVWACDPKGGMELALGAPLFARFAYGAVEGDMVELLEDVERLITARAAAFMGTTRSHVPTPDDPHVVVVLDELAGLTAYLGDRDLSKRLDRVLPRVLAQGRAVGVTVIGAVQDPRKRVVDMRSLFPTRVALRTAEADDVALILTDGAPARGAACERIPAHLPGIGYIEPPDTPGTPIRVRAAYHDDTTIRAMADHYRPLARYARTADLIPGHVLNAPAPATTESTGGVAA